MSEEQSTDAAETDAPTDEQTTDSDAEQQPNPTETVDFWKQKAREQEKRAKANAEAAQKLAQIEDANKTEQERLTERLAELEREAGTARAEALRFKIASKFGVSEEDADLFLTGTDEETLTKQAERLALRSEDAGKPRAPRPDPNQGRRSGGSASTADQFAAAVGGLLK